MKPQEQPQMDVMADDKKRGGQGPPRAVAPRKTKKNSTKQYEPTLMSKLLRQCEISLTIQHKWAFRLH
jgi:hypothetical protein